MKKEKLLDERCRGVTSGGEAVFAENGDDGSTLRAIAPAWQHRIQIHCSTRSTQSLGTLPASGSREVAGYNLVFDDQQNRWNCETELFRLEVEWMVDVHDLQTLLSAVSNVASESAILRQPRKFLMRVGPTLAQNSLASAKVTAGILDWATSSKGHILVAALEDGSQSSALRHVIYHEATHLLEPEMVDALEQMKSLIGTCRQTTWVDGKPTVTLPSEAEAALSEINPQYLPSRLDLWRTSLAGLESQLATGLVANREFTEKAGDCDEDLAAEILAETCCSLFWQTGLSAAPKTHWAALDAITTLLPSRIETMLAKTMGERARAYTGENRRPREVTRVLTLPLAYFSEPALSSPACPAAEIR